MLDRILVVTLALFLCLVPALASEGPPPKLEPKTYRSLSGEYSLFVNPSDQYGVGPATYTLSRGGQPQRSCSLQVAKGRTVKNQQAEVMGRRLPPIALEQR